jgi:hypothetical protein
MGQVERQLTSRDLVAMSPAELDALFRRAPAGPVPEGDSQGTVLFATGNPAGEALAAAARLLLWQGKVVSRDGMVVNKVTPFGLHAVRGVVGRGPSWVDGKGCLVIDYSSTSVVARGVRDEIRMAAPGLYLGVAWLARRRVGAFALRFEAVA